LDQHVLAATPQAQVDATVETLVAPARAHVFDVEALLAVIRRQQ
jgi:hypothetical protein